MCSLTTSQPVNYSIKFKISTAKLATCFLLFSSNRVKSLVYIFSCDKQFKKWQCHSICLLVCLLGYQSKWKMSQKVEKVHNYFDLPLPLDDLDSFEFGKNWKQAGAELGQAQLKLGLGFTSTNLHWIAWQLVLLYSLSRPTFHFKPICSIVSNS